MSNHTLPWVVLKALYEAVQRDKEGAVKIGPTQRRFELHQRGRFQDRDCMTCGREFRSQGPHHRLCNRCKDDRTRADGLYVEYETA